MVLDLAKLAKDVVDVLLPCLPMMVTVGGTVLQGAGEKVGADLWDRAKVIWRKLQPKVEARPAAAEAMNDALTSADDDSVAAFRVQVRKILTEDLELAREIRSIFEKPSTSAAVTVTASGERSVAIGGNVTGTSITTGDAHPSRRLPSGDEE